MKLPCYGIDCYDLTWQYLCLDRYDFTCQHLCLTQLTAASAKGWTGLQSLWGEPKTTLATADTSPGEKTSLLSIGGYGSGAAG